LQYHQVCLSSPPVSRTDASCGIRRMFMNESLVAAWLLRDDLSCSSCSQAMLLSVAADCVSMSSTLIVVDVWRRA